MTVRWLKPGDPFVPTVIVLALAAWLLRSFFEPIAWAFLLALATWPLHRRFSSLLPGWFGRDGRALLFTALVALFGLGPFVLVLVVFARQAASWARTLTSTDSLAAPPEWLQRTPLLGSWLIEVWNDELGASGGIRGLLHHADAQKVLGWLEVAGRIALRHVTVDVFAILALFFLFRGGEPLVERLERLVSRLGPHGDACLRLAADTVRATLIGLLLVMMTDGLLVGIACAIAGVPSPLTWAAATAVAASKPFIA
jgi:predicted PurR-regulated permease PerM